MVKIILSKAAQNGIQDVTERNMNQSDSYKKLVAEADRKIEESRYRYAVAYRKATTYLAR